MVERPLGAIASVNHSAGGFVNQAVNLIKLWLQMANSRDKARSIKYSKYGKRPSLFRLAMINEVDLDHQTSKLIGHLVYYIS